jgi:hypothetical protein
MINCRYHRVKLLTQNYYTFSKQRDIISNQEKSKSIEERKIRNDKDLPTRHKYSTIAFINLLCDLKYSRGILKRGTEDL